MFSRQHSDEHQWKNDVMEKLLFAAWKEQRRARRWSVFFKLFFMAYLIALLVFFLPSELPTSAINNPHTALVKLEGMIAPDTRASSEEIIRSLNAAFENKNARGVVLKINSPGGSAVQSDEIFEAIINLRKAYPDKKIYSVISDVGASGAYFVASATDAIYANRSSLVGSIGVIYNGFGFVDSMQKLGVERRVYTAGKNKSMLDPFRAMTESDEQYIRYLLDDVHAAFIDRVKQGRQNKINPERDEDLFSGLAWTGTKAKAMGLIDDFSTDKRVAREIIGQEKMVDYSQPDTLFEKFGLKAQVLFKNWLGLEGIFKQPLMALAPLAG